MRVPAGPTDWSWRTRTRRCARLWIGGFSRPCRRTRQAACWSTAARITPHALGLHGARWHPPGYPDRLSVEGPPRAGVHHSDIGKGQSPSPEPGRCVDDRFRRPATTLPPPARPGQHRGRRRRTAGLHRRQPQKPKARAAPKTSKAVFERSTTPWTASRSSRHGPA